MMTASDGGRLPGRV